MNTLTSITSDIAAWLDAHTDPELPRLCHLHVPGETFQPSARLQIAEFRTPLSSLAAWSRHLDLPITVAPDTVSAALNARIHTHTSSGHALELYRSVHLDAWMALETTSGRRYRSEPAQVPADIVEQAAIQAGEHP